MISVLQQVRNDVCESGEFIVFLDKEKIFDTMFDMTPSLFDLWSMRKMMPVHPLINLFVNHPELRPTNWTTPSLTKSL